MLCTPDVFNQLVEELVINPRLLREPDNRKRKLNNRTYLLKQLNDRTARRLISSIETRMPLQLAMARTFVTNKDLPIEWSVSTTADSHRNLKLITDKGFILKKIQPYETADLNRDGMLERWAWHIETLVDRLKTTHTQSSQSLTAESTYQYLMPFDQFLVDGAKQFIPLIPSHPEILEQIRNKGISCEVEERFSSVACVLPCGTLHHPSRFHTEGFLEGNPTVNMDPAALIV